MKRLSLTFSGATSTLSDNIGLLAGDLGKVFLPVATDVTVAFTDLVKGIREYTKETKAGKIEGFNNQIERTEENIANINTQLGAAKQDNFLFKLFGGDAQAETISLNNQLKTTEAQLAKLKALRDKAKAEPEDSSAVGGKEEKPSDKLLEQVAAAQALSGELEAIANQKVANDKARASASNAAIVEQLDIQKEIILQKESEKQIALLESQGLFEQAQEEQAKENLRRVEVAEQASIDKRKKQAQDANKDFINFAKLNAEAEIKWDQESYRQRAQTAQKGLAALASLQSTGSKEAFEIGKAASIAQALVAIPTTAIEAYKSLAGIPVVGPGLGAAAAAAAVVAGTAQVNQIRAQQFTAFAEGGLVTGGVKGKDSVPALLTPGEVVVPEKNFESLNIRGRGEGEDQVKREISRTNELLVELIQSVGTTQSEGFLEEKFSSSTPGGIFYEPVDDGGGLGEIEVERVRAVNEDRFTTGRDRSKVRARERRRK